MNLDELERLLDAYQKVYDESTFNVMDKLARMQTAKDNLDAALRNAARELIADAKLGAIAIRFIDRANDVAECDPAERILSEWANEVNAVLAAMQEQKP